MKPSVGRVEAIITLITPIINHKPLKHKQGTRFWEIAE
jgi:hypothetical protein